jgi:hypothetical protein
MHPQLEQMDNIDIQTSYMARTSLGILCKIFKEMPLPVYSPALCAPDFLRVPKMSCVWYLSSYHRRPEEVTIPEHILCSVMIDFAWCLEESIEMVGHLLHSVMIDFTWCLEGSTMKWHDISYIQFSKSVVNWSESPKCINTNRLYIPSYSALFEHITIFTQNLSVISDRLCVLTHSLPKTRKWQCWEMGGFIQC